MIDHQIVDGQPCTVAYLKYTKNKFLPASRKNYNYIKLIFKDGRRIYLVRPANPKPGSVVQFEQGGSK
jgi:hypothetical protein